MARDSVAQSDSFIRKFGSVTRARPGDALAPDRISDFGPADIDALGDTDPMRRAEIFGRTGGAEAATGFGAGMLVLAAIILWVMS